MKTGACSYNIDPSINKPILSILKLRNSNGTTVVTKDKIALYKKQLTRNAALTWLSESLAISESVDTLIARLTMETANTNQYLCTSKIIMLSIDSCFDRIFQNSNPNRIQSVYSNIQNLNKFNLI